MTYPTIRQLLEESDVDASLVKQKIEALCGPFLSQWNQNGFLWRGASRSTKRAVDDDGYAIVAVRPNRRPLNTDPWIHTQFNSILQKAGFEARRDNSIFVMNDEFNASSYSSDEEAAVAVFPIGQYDFTWSPDVGDFTIQIAHRVNASLVSDERERFERGDVTLLDEWGYTQTDINAAIDSTHEIMVKCNSVIVVRADIARRLYPSAD